MILLNVLYVDERANIFVQRVMRAGWGYASGYEVVKSPYTELYSKRAIQPKILAKGGLKAPKR